jgi:hypothetical protein
MAGQSEAVLLDAWMTERSTEPTFTGDQAKPNLELRVFDELPHLELGYGILRRSRSHLFGHGL